MKVKTQLLFGLIGSIIILQCNLVNCKMKKLRVMVMRDSASGKKAAEVITGNNGNGILGGMMMMDSRPDMNMMRGGYGNRGGGGQKPNGGKSSNQSMQFHTFISLTHRMLMTIFFPTFLSSCSPMDLFRRKLILRWRRWRWRWKLLFRRWRRRWRR